MEPPLRTQKVGVCREALLGLVCCLVYFQTAVELDLK
jgi:hypothetical protein